MSKNFRDRTGEISVNKQGYKTEIVECFSAINISVKIDDIHILKNIRYDHFKDKSIINPYHPSIFGVGFMGVGKYKSKVNGKTTQTYQTWHHMFKRGYSEQLKNKYPTYKDVIVCKEWHNFQNFAKWHEENFKPHMVGWHLDKDIIKKNSKIYSPYNCDFVPSDINVIFTKRQNHRGNLPIGVFKQLHRYYAKISKFGKQIRLGGYATPEEAFEVYKNAKQNYNREMAMLWRHLISKRIYQAMIKYPIEITD